MARIKEKDLMASRINRLPIPQDYSTNIIYEDWDLIKAKQHRIWKGGLWEDKRIALEHTELGSPADHSPGLHHSMDT